LNIKKTLVICDKDEDELSYSELSILCFIMNFLKCEYHLNVVKKIFLSKSYIKRINTKTTYLLENDKSNMVTSYLEIEDILDKRKILFYSDKANPELARKIRFVKKERILNILLEEYEKQFYRQDTIRFENEMYQISQKFGLENKANVIELFFDNRLIFSHIHSHLVPNYSLIGRGFYALGATNKIIGKRGKKTKLFRVYIPLSITKNLSEEIRINCLIEILNHQLFGHVKNNLKDHFIINNQINDCIMTIEDSFIGLIGKAQKRAGIYLCDKCLEIIKNNKKRSRGGGS